MGTYLVLFHCNTKCHQFSDNLSPMYPVQRTLTHQLFLRLLAPLSLFQSEFTEVPSESGRCKVSSFYQSWVSQNEDHLHLSSHVHTSWISGLLCWPRKGQWQKPTAGCIFNTLCFLVYILNYLPHHFTLLASFTICFYRCFTWHTSTRQPNVMGNQHQNSRKGAKEPGVLQC